MSSAGVRPTPTVARTSTRSQFEEALARLEAKGMPPAAVILDGVMQSDGVRVLTAEYVADLATPDQCGRCAVDRRRGPRWPWPHG